MILKPRLFRKPRKGHWASKGLLGFWLENEADGDITNDLSGNYHLGTLQAGMSWVAGRFGPVTYSDGGVTGYIDTGWQWNLGTGAYTLSCWYKGTEATDFAGLVGAAISGNTGCILGIKDNDAFVWLNNDNHAGSVVMNDDVWHFIAFTRNGTVGKIYVDGIRDTGDKVVDAASVNAAQNVWINGWGDTGFNSQGSVDLPMIFDRELTASEIALLYREPFCMFEQEPIEIWTASFGAGAPPVGNAAIMTTNTGFWGPTF